jgi:hypothetical protein
MDFLVAITLQPSPHEINLLVQKVFLSGKVLAPEPNSYARNRHPMPSETAGHGGDAATVIGNRFSK